VCVCLRVYAQSVVIAIELVLGKRYPSEGTCYVLVFAYVLYVLIALDIVFTPPFMLALSDLSNLVSLPQLRISHALSHN